jgi:virginiamycin B lyase
MRVLKAICLVLAIAANSGFASDSQKGKKGTAMPSLPAQGIKTPGVQIPFADLKSEAALDTAAAAAWIASTDSILIPTKDGLAKVDPRAKETKFGDPLTGLNKPCAGAVTAFTSLWVPNCGDGTVARVDTKTGKVTATLNTGTGSAHPGIAGSGDSVWMFTDGHGTLSRIDPVQNVVVAEFRVFQDCNSLLFGEAALWLTCPAENKVLRIDPATNLVDKSIEVSATPTALAIGETSVWVLCEKDGKLARIDPKTYKVTKTIELGAPAVGGSLAVGEGSVWVSMPGFPITRIDPTEEKVVQQFYGEGYGALVTTTNSVWLADAHAGKLVKFDSRRIAATLAE